MQQQIDGALSEIGRWRIIRQDFIAKARHDCEQLKEYHRINLSSTGFASFIGFLSGIAILIGSIYVPSLVLCGSIVSVFSGVLNPAILFMERQTIERILKRIRKFKLGDADKLERLLEYQHLQSKALEFRATLSLEIHHQKSDVFELIKGVYGIIATVLRISIVVLVFQTCGVHEIRSSGLIHAFTIIVAIFDFVTLYVCWNNFENCPKLVDEIKNLAVTFENQMTDLTANFDNGVPFIRQHNNYN